MSAENHPDRTGHDLGVAVFFLVWAAVGWVSVAMNAGLAANDFGLDPGPSLMPVIVLSVLSVGGLALAVSPVAALLARRGKLHWSMSIDWRRLAFFVSVAGFPVAMQAVGYIAATLVFVFVWGLLLAPDIRDRPMRSAVVAAVASVVTTLVVYGGFDLVIRAQLP